MNPWDQLLMATLLLSLLSFVIVVGGLLVYLVLRWRQTQGAGAAFMEVGSIPLVRGRRANAALAFKGPQCWLAVRNRNVLAIQNALALDNAKPCSWAEVLSGEGGPRLFVSPPVQGWVLVMGSALPDPGDDVDKFFRFLLDLSAKLGHVQYFNANGILNQHAWAQAESGRILRGYAWAGKTLWNQGPVTEAERALRMKCYAYAEAPLGAQFGYPEPNANNAEKVPLLAARWSVNPEEIDERFIEEGWGIVGELSRRF